MGKTRRHPELALVLARQGNAKPLAERGRALADVHRYIEDLPQKDLHQLALAEGMLNVEASQHTTARKGLVVLDQALGYPQLGVAVTPVGLQEIAPLVPEDLGLDDERPG